MSIGNKRMVFPLVLLIFIFPIQARTGRGNPQMEYTLSQISPMGGAADERLQSLDLTFPLYDGSGSVFLFLPLGIDCSLFDSNRTTRFSGGLRIAARMEGYPAVVLTLGGSVALTDSETPEDWEPIGNLLLIFSLRDDFQFLTGLNYDGNLSPYPIPLAGISWRMSEAWNMDILFPRQAILVYALSERLGIRGGVYFSQIGVSSGTTLQYKSRTMSIRMGIDFLWGESIQLRADSGVSVYRFEEIRESENSFTSVINEPLPVFSFSIGYYFPK